MLRIEPIGGKLDTAHINGDPFWRDAFAYLNRGDDVYTLKSSRLRRLIKHQHDPDFKIITNLIATADESILSAWSLTLWRYPGTPQDQRLARWLVDCFEAPKLSRAFWLFILSKTYKRKDDVDGKETDANKATHAGATGTDGRGAGELDSGSDGSRQAGPVDQSVETGTTPQEPATSRPDAT